MKVILQQDVKGHGKRGQLVDVSDGYARNFLFPKKLAVPANADNMNKMVMQDKAKKAKEAAEKAEAEATAKKLADITVKPYTPNADIEDPEQLSGGDVTLVIDHGAYFNFYLNDVDKAQAKAELMDAAHMGRLDAAVLTAVNIADELYKAQESAENLRRQLKTYLDEASQAKAEISELKRQLFKQQTRK